MYLGQTLYQQSRRAWGVWNKRYLMEKNSQVTVSLSSLYPNESMAWLSLSSTKEPEISNRSTRV